MDTVQAALASALTQHTGRILRDALALVTRDVLAAVAPKPAPKPTTVPAPVHDASPARPTSKNPSSPEAVARAVERVRNGDPMTAAMRAEGVSYNKLARAMRDAGVKSKHSVPFSGKRWVDAMTDAHEPG